MQKSCSPFKFNKRYFPKGNDWLKWKVDESKLSEKNKKVLEQIRNNHTCFVHVRRGDYLASNYKSIFEGCCTLEYYKKALKFLQDKYKDIKFICFSDDLQWMKQNLPLGDNATFVDWNTGKNSPLDIDFIKNIHLLLTAGTYDAQLLGKLEVAATDHLVLTYVVYENSLIMSSFRYHVGHLAHKQRAVGGMNGGLDDL